MARVDQSMASKVLGVRESIPSVVRASDDYVQTLALMLGYDDANRIPLRCSPSGVLSIASPCLADVFHWLSVAPNEPHQGPHIACTEILAIAHPDNTGRIWVRTRIAASTTNAIPIDAGDKMGFSVANLNQLRALIVATGDALIVGYTV